MIILIRSNQQRSDDDALLPNNEQTWRLHVDADVRYCGVQFEKRGRTKHHMH